MQNDFNFSFFVAEILNTTQDLKSQWVILLATEIYTVLVVIIGDFLPFQLVALCYVNRCTWIILVLLLLVLVITAVHTRWDMVLSCVHDFSKVLLKAMTMCEQDDICLSKTFLISSIESTNNRLNTEEHNLMTAFLCSKHKKKRGLNAW